MSDRELLEKAARAAGYEPQGMEQGKLYLYGVQDGWNPLESDADAFRLAVNLVIDVCFNAVSGVDAWSCDMFGEPYGDDPAAATRRAIVRAAAALGEGGK